MAEGCCRYKIYDYYTAEEIQEDIKNDLVLHWIDNHCMNYTHKDGIEKWHLPVCGPNGIDFSKID